MMACFYFRALLLASSWRRLQIVRKSHCIPGGRVASKIVWSARSYRTAPTARMTVSRLVAGTLCSGSGRLRGQPRRVVHVDHVGQPCASQSSKGFVRLAAIGSADKDAFPRVRHGTAPRKRRIRRNGVCQPSPRPACQKWTSFSASALHQPANGIFRQQAFSRGREFADMV